MFEDFLVAFIIQGIVYAAIYAVAFQIFDWLDKKHWPNKYSKRWLCAIIAINVLIILLIWFLLYRYPEYIYLSILILLYALGCWAIFLWIRKAFKKYKNEDKVNIKDVQIITQYFPPEHISPSWTSEYLSPSEVGFLYSWATSQDAIISLLYKRAAEGLIKFNYTKRFFWNKVSIDILKPENHLRWFEKATWNRLFKNKLSTKKSNSNIELPNTTFSEWVYKSINSLHSHMRNEKYIVENCKWELISIIIGAIFYWWISIAYLIYSINSDYFYADWIEWVCAHAGLMLVFGFIGILIWYWISKKISRKYKYSKKWIELHAHVAGYRNFIKYCDENVLKTFLKEDPLYIDKILPYAIALWLKTKFLKIIKKLSQDVDYSDYSLYNTDIKIISNLVDSIKANSNPNYWRSSSSWGGSSYSSSGWHSWWSSFGWGWWWGWWHSWWWWGGWWWRSW